jgi:hypothetical protein
LFVDFFHLNRTNPLADSAFGAFFFILVYAKQGCPLESFEPVYDG